MTTESAQKDPVRDLIAESRERFVQETAEHELTVLHDDGLYRHLRFQKPGTSMYHFDLITWPGHLTITGDCGSFQFSRTADMFEFFSLTHGGINPGYWSQKLRAPEPAAARTYSYEKFCARVMEWFEEVSSEMTPERAAELRGDIEERLIAEHLAEVHSEFGAQYALAEFEHDGLRIGDTWEWDLFDYEWSFLWCCWAIASGIEQYRSAKSTDAPDAI